MNFFVDTADPNEINELAATGLFDGVTTNPSLVSKVNRELRSILAEIREVVQGPGGCDGPRDHAEGAPRVLSKIIRNITVKVPLT
jgi:transaldolase